MANTSASSRSAISPKSATTCRDLEAIRRFAVARAAPRAGPRPAGARRHVRQLLPRKLAVHRRPRRRDRRAPRRVGQDLRAGRRAVAEDDRLRRRQGPRDAQVRRRLHVLRARRRISRHEVGARLPEGRSTSRARDHHSTVMRVRAGLQAMGLGIPPGYPDYVLHKMVTVMRGGEEVKISKRAGNYVTIRELIDEAGRDAVRYLPRLAQGGHRVRVRHRPRALASRRRIPVYYVQYAHARVCSVLRQAGIAPADAVGALARADIVAARRAPTSRRCCAGSPTFPGSSRRPRASSRRTRSRPTSRNWPRNSTVTIMRSDSWSTTSN